MKIEKITTLAGKVERWFERKKISWLKVCYFFKNSQETFKFNFHVISGFIFFSDGLDTTQSSSNYCIRVGKKSREVEVASTLNGKSVTYETLHEMKLLDQELFLNP